MENYFEFVKKNAFEFESDTMKKEFQSLRSMMNFVDMYENVQVGRDEHMKKILEDNGVRCDMFKAIKAIKGIVRESLSTEAYMYRFEIIEDEWIDEFFNFLRSNPKNGSYLCPKSVSELIMLYKDHREDYRDYLNEYIK